MAVRVNCPYCEAENQISNETLANEISCRLCLGLFIPREQVVEIVEEAPTPVGVAVDTSAPFPKRKSRRTDLDDHDGDGRAKREDRDSGNRNDASRSEADTPPAPSKSSSWETNGPKVVIAIIAVVVVVGLSQVIQSSYQQVKSKLDDSANESRPTLQTNQKTLVIAERDPRFDFDRVAPVQPELPEIEPVKDPVVEKPKPKDETPKPQPKVQPVVEKSEFDKHLDQLRAELNRHQCSWFVSQPVREDRRREVARALAGGLTHHDPWTMIEAARALQTWGGPETVPLVVQAFDVVKNASESKRRQEALLELLGTVKDPTAHKALVDQTIARTEVRQKGIEVLEKVGSSVEREVWRMLTHSDVDVRIAGCKVLTKVGTHISLNLVRATQQSSFGNPDARMLNLNREARNAVFAIERRGS